MTITVAAAAVFSVLAGFANRVTITITQLTRDVIITLLLHHDDVVLTK